MTGPTPEEQSKDEQSSDSAQLDDAELDQIAGGEEDEGEPNDFIDQLQGVFG